MPSCNRGVKYFMVQTCDYIAIKNVFREYLMTEENDPYATLREVCKIQVSTTTQSPLGQNRCINRHPKEKEEKETFQNSNVTVSAWVGWLTISISFLCILLNFLNCYNDFPDQTTNKTKTQNRKSGSKAIYLFSRPMAMSVYKVLSWASSSMMALESEGQSQWASKQPPHKPIQTLKGLLGI